MDRVKDLDNVVVHIWKRYYRFLEKDDMKEVSRRMKIIDEWIGVGGITSCCNTVQRCFYRIAKEKGWKKKKDGRWERNFELREHEK